MNKQMRNIYRARRAALGQIMGNAFFVLRGAGEVTRNGDVKYPFRQESNFLYLTGWTHPDAFLIIEGGETPRSTIFFDPQSARDRLWNGKTPTHADAIAKYGFDSAETRKDGLMPRVNNLTRSNSVFYYDTHVPHTLSGISLTPHMWQFARDGSSLLATMRHVKDKTEVATMRAAAKCSGLAHREIMRLCHPNINESDLAAIFTAHALKNGADPLHAYPSIVASGANACTLHYGKNSAKIKDGDLVLVDAGCEMNGYASDITRTFPANGLFTEAQRILYEIVLRAQKEAIAMAICGSTVGDVHEVATLAIAEGLIQHEFLDYPDAERAVLSGNVSKFFPHSTSHWLGLDVHDVGDYKKNASGIAQCKLLPGMVITVEPGIYIPKRMKSVHARFHGMGIRIEDDVLITQKGNEILSRDAPKEVEDIEEVMARNVLY